MNPLRRRWWPHRQAWSPSPWVTYAGAMVISLAVWAISLLFPAMWWRLAAQLVIQIVLVSAWADWRYRRWKRRHPVLSPRELHQRIVDDAKWN